ncbi:meiosis inhibitor protein 1 isoform X2 [Neolamprologus brichardi]|uniref:meiosis inhibitor protein 1 isoform X2 n=1 Tax=Neolamprologus brichardi TaxID=32507 RepID=UPI0003EC5178|nr:meiosis inhibitor protein 1 isoform X2 [Neolamprologus brichardi]
MTSRDIVCKKIHFRHDPKWSRRLGPVEGGGLLLCVACLIEMIDDEDIASVRKSSALSSVSGVLKCSPGALRELLQQDHRVCLHFTAKLLGMLQTAEDPVTLEKVDQVLVQLLLELQSELSFRFVLDEIHKQLSEQLSVKHFLPTFSFLGNLIKAAPTVSQSLVTHYVPLLDRLCSALLFPDEALKGAVVYVWLQLLGAPGGSAAQSLPSAVRDRVCNVLLKTLANASSPQLLRDCVGLLSQLVHLADAVSVLMNSLSCQVMCDENEDILANNSQSLSQNQDQQPPDHCLLPLILKKLLLSGDENLQVTSAKCIASVLVHSPSQYSAPFINADVPEFLFDRLACSSNEVLLWSAYSCLLLLTEEPLFFSQCHSVYGMESLVRSLKESLQLTNLEVPKQGLLLLREILERQPASVRLFPSGAGFVAVSEVLVGGVSSSCLLVATQAASVTSALFRLDHQSRPVQYEAIIKLIEAITNRFVNLTLPSPAHLRSSGRMKRSDPSSQALRSERFLLQSLVCFQSACRLAEECASDPVLKENTFTAPYKHSGAQDSLESLCQCLLRCCDAVWIPTVIRMCERAPSAPILQNFYSILSSQFTLLPSLMPAFANKLASSGFYRLAVEHKGLLCAGNRNPNLNASCCGFLQKLSMCLLSPSDLPSGSHQHDLKEVENLLLHNLPSLCYRLSEWPSVLCEYQGPQAPKYCLVIVLYLALQQGDRLLPDQIVFSNVVWLLRSVQEQGCVLPHSVLRSALYLLALTQDKSPSLDGASLNCISKALSSCQSFSSLYFHHAALIHFMCRYPELAEKFAAVVLELWLTKEQDTNTGLTPADTQEEKESCADERSDQKTDTETMELLSVMEKYPAVILTLLDMVCTREAPLAERVLGVLEVLLGGQRGYNINLCTKLRPALLQALQRVSVVNTDHWFEQEYSAQVNSLPLVLKLLCVTQASDPPSSPHYSNMEGVHFKLLYHAVSMLLSNSGLMDQLQTVFSSSSSSSSSSSATSLSPSACPPLALLCCCHLLLSSLITLQRVHSTQVRKSITWSLDTAVQRLLTQKRNTDSLLLISYLRLLQVLLDTDLASEVVCLTSGPGLVGLRPLGVEDGALYPLGSRGAQCLSIALSGLLLQKHELLLRASVNCLSSLLGFLQRKSPATAKHVVCQPWSRFLLHSLLSSGQSCLLHPAILRFIILLLQDSGTPVLREPDLLQVMEGVERRGVKELSKEAEEALRLLLTQIQSRDLLPREEHKQKVKNMIEELGESDESCRHSQSHDVLHVGDVPLCLSDFVL